MSYGHSGVCELLIDIKKELEIQINAKQDTAINMEKLLELSSVMPNRLMGCGLPSETIESLTIFADSIYVNATTRENLRSHLITTNQFINKLCSINP